MHSLFLKEIKIEIGNQYKFNENVLKQYFSLVKEENSMTFCVHFLLISELFQAKKLRNHYFYD